MGNFGFSVKSYVFLGGNEVQKSLIVIENEGDDNMKEEILKDRRKL